MAPKFKFLVISMLMIDFFSLVGSLMDGSSTLNRTTIPKEAEKIWGVFKYSPGSVFQRPTSIEVGFPLLSPDSEKETLRIRQIQNQHVQQNISLSLYKIARSSSSRELKNELRQLLQTGRFLFRSCPSCPPIPACPAIPSSVICPPIPTCPTCPDIPPCPPLPPSPVIPPCPTPVSSTTKISACGVTTNTAFSASNSGIIDIMFGLNAPACTIGIAAPLPYTKVQVTCTGTIPGESPMIGNPTIIQNLVAGTTFERTGYTVISLPTPIALSSRLQCSWTSV